MEWHEVGDKRHYRAVGRRGTYDLHNIQNSWEVWFQPKFTRGYQHKTAGIKYLFEAKRYCEGLDAEE